MKQSDDVVYLHHVLDAIAKVDRRVTTGDIRLCEPPTFKRKELVVEIREPRTETTSVSDANRQEQTELLKRMRAAFADISEEQLANDVARVIAEIRQSRSQVA